MQLKLNMYGTILTSRPAGKEAYLAAKACRLPQRRDETIEVDFTGVQVLTPAWADEFLTPLFFDCPEKVMLLSTENASVKTALEILGRK